MKKAIFTFMIILCIGYSSLHQSALTGHNNSDKNDLETNAIAEMQSKYYWRPSDIFWSDIANYDNCIIVIDVFRGMIIFNGTSSREMQIISETKAEYLGNSNAGTLVVYQHYVIYAPQNHDSIAIYDISNLVEPQLVGEYSLGIGEFVQTKLYVYNDNLFVYRINTFYVFSLSIITEPTYLGLFETNFGNSNANRIVLKDDLLFIDEKDYFMDRTQISIYNISDIEYIQLLGNYSILPSVVSNISVNGSQIFVSLYEKGLYIFNYSLTDNPTLLYNFSSSYSQEATIYDAQIIDEYLYVLNEEEGLMLFSSDDYASIISKANYSIAWEYTQMFHNEEYIFLLEGLGNIDVYAISGAPSLRFITSIDFGAYNYVDISFKGTLGFICCEEDGLYIVDFADQANPEIKVKIRRKAIFIKSIFIDNNLFVLDYLGNILVYDISNPTKPVSINNYTLTEPQVLSDMLIINDTLFVSSYSSGLFSLDVSDPTDISQIEHFTNFGNISHIELYDHVLFAIFDNATTGVYGLGFINMTNPQTIEPIGKLELTNDFLTSLTIDNYMAYIGVINNSIFQIDLHNLTIPTIQNFAALRTPVDFFVYHHYLYTANIGHSILVYDISQHLKPVAYFHEGYFGQCLAQYSNYIVLGESYFGVYFLNPYNPQTKGFGYTTIGYIFGMPTIIVLIVIHCRKKRKNNDQK
jgi:hypothetical protein